MKINKKKVAKWTIEAAIFFGGIALGVYAIIRVTSNINSFVVYLLVESAIAVIYAATVMPLLAVVEAAFPDFRKGFIDQLKAHKTMDVSSYTIVASNHGDNLKEVMEAIRCEEWEYSAVFDPSGKKISEGTYQSSKFCSIPIKDWLELIQRGEEVINMHNHPGADCLSFSAGDFAVFLGHDFIRQSIVVTRKYNYILTKTSDSYEKFRDEVENYAGEMFTKYLWLGILHHRLWTVLVSRKTAKKYGLEFRVERVSREARPRDPYHCALPTDH